MKTNRLVLGIVMCCLVCLAACNRSKPDGNFAPVVKAAMEQHEFLHYISTVDGQVLVLFDGDSASLPDSVCGRPLRWVDSSAFDLQPADGEWPSIYRVELRFDGDTAFDVLVSVYHLRMSGRWHWMRMPEKDPFPLARGVWDGSKWQTVSQEELLRRRIRPMAIDGVPCTVAKEDFDYTVGHGDTVLLQGLRRYPATIDSAAIDKARAEELYLMMEMGDTLLVVAHQPGLLSLHSLTREMTMEEVGDLMPAGSTLVPPVHEEPAEGDCSCGPHYLEVYVGGDTIVFSEAISGCFDLEDFVLRSDAVDFAGIKVGMPLNDMAALHALPQMDYSRYCCVLFVRPDELDKAWYGLPNHRLNWDPNLGLHGILLMEASDGLITQLRYNSDYFHHGRWQRRERAY